MPSSKKKKLFWQIPLLIILGLTAIELSFPFGLMDWPVLREIKVRWYTMRLGNDDFEVQKSAAGALWKMGPKAKAAVPALIAALDSNHPDVRAHAAHALGAIGPDAEDAVEPLLQIQERYAWTALGQIGEAGVVPLITRLQDKDASVREQAAKALDAILHAREPKLAQKAMQPLINALQDEDVRVRGAAARAMFVLVDAVKDPASRATVAQSLCSAMEYGEVGTYADFALGKLGPAAVPALIVALKSDNADVRRRSADRLKQIDPEAAKKAGVK